LCGPRPDEPCNSSRHRVRKLTHHTTYSAFEGDPIHRFFQMWQQIGMGHNTDLFVWVADTAGAGDHTTGTFVNNTHQGGVAMGFYNMGTGDAPLFAAMARNYACAPGAASRRHRL
jgi:hypothetical protein